MTTIDLENFAPQSKPARKRLLAGWFSRWRGRRAQRLALIELNHLDAHLLRDMGIEPQDVIDALAGRNSSLLFDPIRRHRD